MEKIDKNVKIGSLFEIYGKLLSANQFEIMNDYINNDLTLTEIAQNKSITRQAVKDLVVKVEKKLLKWEDNLNIFKRINKLEYEIKLLKKEN